jgi:long-chain acyl-CoA synthetase
VSRTIPQLWRDAVATGVPRTPYLAERDGGWEAVSWDEAAGRVEELANGLLALGVRKGDAFGILGATSLDWALFDFALAHVGGVTAPVYSTSSARDCAYVLAHSGSVGVLCEDEEQSTKIDAVRAELPELRHVLTFAGLDDLAARGREFAAAHPGALDAAVAAIDEEDLYTFIYTSGTTGPPKGCMIRHRNYHAMAESVCRVDQFLIRDDVLLLYLPLAHNFGRLMHLLGPAAGVTIAFCADPYRVSEALESVRPTIFPSVPRIFEKVHTAVGARLADASGPRRHIGDWALGVGRRVSTLRLEGKPLPRSLALKHRLADRLVYRKVKDRLGGRIRFAISGGAPLAAEIAEFFHALDILILEGYGLTECTTACSVNRPDRFRFGTVGLPLPGVEMTTSAEGELLVRGETVFAGYHGEEEATRAVLGEDGWLRTGDVGQIDADGFIRITDRMKDIIVTAGGKNVSPQNLENELKASRFVSQALVVGDRRPYLVALITLDTDEIERWRAGDQGDVDALVAGAVAEVNRERTSFEQIKRFAVLPRDFCAEDGEVTPTLKLRRRVCEQHFCEEIELLYETDAAAP